LIEAKDFGRAYKPSMSSPTIPKARRIELNNLMINVLRGLL